jgi:hypothetical protein
MVTTVNEEFTMSTEQGTPTFESRVNEVIAATTKSDDGKLVLPEGTDEALAFAAKAELRRRDTQGAYTKNQQRLKALEAENEKLASSWESDAVSNLSNSEQARLEELKVQDPDAWRSEIAKIEGEKRTQFQEKRQAISEEASKLTEVERRGLQLEQFNKDNPDINLSDEVIANDIPPRITRKLEAGEIQFDEFLNEVATYLGKGKKIAPGAKAPEEPNFQGARGSNTPSKEAVEKQNSDDYSKEIF